MRNFYPKTESQVKTYSPTDFLCRLSRTKHLLAGLGLDGLLLIAGSDGCSNQGTNVLLNYLFTGTFGMYMNFFVFSFCLGLCESKWVNFIKKIRNQIFGFFC